MLEITYDRYDELDEMAEAEEVSLDYEFPSLENIENNLNTEEDLKAALIAYYNSADKKYVKAIDKIFHEQIVFCEKEIQIELPQNKKIGSKNLLQIVEIVKRMDFQPEEYFCPSILQLKTYLTNNEQDTAFLLWLQNDLMQRESRDETEEEVMNWITNRLNKLFKNTKK